jgi:hypothetical protein
MTQTLPISTYIALDRPHEEFGLSGPSVWVGRCLGRRRVEVLSSIIRLDIRLRHERSKCVVKLRIRKPS